MRTAHALVWPAWAAPFITYFPREFRATVEHARAERRKRRKRGSSARAESPPNAAGRAADAFHAHLDECRQCREHPFDLCGVGHILAVAL